MPDHVGRLAQIERLCRRDDLRTDDPYDIWKTPVGYAIKDLFNRQRWLGLLPAAALTVFDTYLNNRLRLFYRPQEYPIVRAWAALVLLNLHRRQPRGELLQATGTHVDWLLAHASQGYSGPCWGLGFRQPIMKGLHYPADLPLATMTPYALEAIVGLHRAGGDSRLLPAIHGIHAFFNRDLQVMDEGPDYLVTSYSTLRDRRVTNAVSYVLFALGLMLPYVAEPERQSDRDRIGKLYRFLAKSQNEDGSWYYSPDGPPFIDCFHSCIVLKNLIRSAPILGDDAGPLIDRGYRYLLDHFRDARTGLFRRFSLENKPSLVRFDLYDNAEMIHLATLMGDRDLAHDLAARVEQHFCHGTHVFGQIDRFGLRHNRDMLRWAVMPYFHALTALGA